MVMFYLKFNFRLYSEQWYFISQLSTHRQGTKSFNPKSHSLMCRPGNMHMQRNSVL